MTINEKSQPHLQPQKIKYATQLMKGTVHKFICKNMNNKFRVESF